MLVVLNRLQRYNFFEKKQSVPTKKTVGNSLMGCAISIVFVTLRRKRFNMKRTSLIIVLLSIARIASAVIAPPEPVEKRMPDGSIQKVYICGDENYHYLTRLDGTKIAGSEVGDPMMSQTMMAHRAPARVQLSSYVPNKGTVRIPVILVNFTDLSFTLPNAREQFSNLYNDDGGSNPNATGSVHDYYMASSDSALNLVFDVYGPYDLSHNMAYYGANSGANHNVRAGSLVVEAAALARNAGVDFSQYDNDGDGYVDNLSVVVAGYNEAEGGPENSIWPHYSAVTAQDMFSGKRLGGYLIISEYRSNMGSTQAGIGTYCHEFGHALGLPDLYDTENSRNYTVGTWDIMCSGSYNNNGSTPPTFTAFERFMMGWLMPEQLHHANNYVLEPIETSNKAYLVADNTHNMSTLYPSPNEYFLMENRQALGWDANKGALVGTGMMITHITFSADAWNYNRVNNSEPLGFRVVSAGFVSSSYSSPQDLFPAETSKGRVTTWMPTLNNGTKLTSQMVMNITQLDNKDISFHYGVSDDRGFIFQPQTLNDMVTTYDKGPIEYQEEEVALAIKGVKSDSMTIRSSSDYFEFSWDGGETWYRSQEIKVHKDSSYVLTLKVRYAPVRQSCTKRVGYLIVESQDGEFFNQMQMEGTAPRPTYITTPVITEVKDVTTSSFTAYWEEQEDAELFYVTLYSMSPLASEEEETFETFTTIENVEAAGWESNFARLTNAVSEHKYAVLFQQTGEYLTSKEYMEPPMKVRFWLSNTYVPIADESVAGGKLAFEATRDGWSWDTIDNITLDINTSGIEKEYSLQGKDYTRFRFVYTHTRGTGGPVIDGFTATLGHTFNYVYRDRQRGVFAATPCATFTDLTEGTTYYLSVQSYEDKGCEEHLSALSPARVIRTAGGENTDVQMVVMRQEDGSYMAILPEPMAEDATMYIYDYVGHIIADISVVSGETEIVVPTKNLSKGNYYILKLTTGKLKRKAAKGKMLYY